jgi:hypothetical protein
MRVGGANDFAALVRCRMVTGNLTRRSAVRALFCANLFSANSVHISVECPFSPGKLVRIAGLEPANGVFSSLLIIAFLVTYLLVSLRHCHLFASFFSHLWATSSRKRRVGLCQDFGLCRNCVRTDSVSALCRTITRPIKRASCEATRGEAGIVAMFEKELLRLLGFG